MLAGYASGALSPVEVLDSCLDRIGRLDPRLNSVLHLDAEGAREAARAAEHAWRRRKPSGALCGVPVGIKDIVDVAGLPTTCHSKILQGNLARQDAEVVRRLRKAGAVILAKLATHEFAIGGPSFDLPAPPARNPWNPDHNPGGSSSGSAVAVAAGLMPVAVGTDTAGSIRHPAGACGILGLKPSYEAVPRRGVFPLAFSLDHVGPLGRSSADISLAYSVMSGRDLPPEATRPVRLDGLRIGYVRHFHDADVTADPEVVAALDATAARLERLGADLREVTLAPLREFLGVNRVVMYSEAWSIHADWLRARPQDYGASARQRLMIGAFFTAEDYLLAQRQRTALCAGVDGVLAEVDLLLVANMLDPACRIDDTDDLARTGDRQARAPFNVTGHPALSIPTGFSAAGLPLCGQIVGRRGGEATVMRASEALEQGYGATRSLAGPEAWAGREFRS